MPLNPWTRHLFEQLSHVGPNHAGCQAASGSSEKASGAEQEHGEAPQAWTRDMIELLFMAPGALPMTPPMAFAPGGATSSTARPADSAKEQPPRSHESAAAAAAAGAPAHGHEA